jgi:hypothetical protein
MAIGSLIEEIRQKKEMVTTPVSDTQKSHCDQANYLKLAAMQTDSDKAMELCKQVKSGQGWFEVAKILRERNDPEWIAYCYRAGTMGIGDAYQTLADHYQQSNEKQKEKDMYWHKALLGDRTAYLEVSRLTDDPEEKSQYELASQDFDIQEFLDNDLKKIQ